MVTAGQYRSLVDFFRLRVKKIFITRPALRDALLWALPALLLAVAIRLLLFYMVPFALYGTDSFSYFAFPSSLYFDGEFDFPEKRRWIYPLFVLPTFYLPGAPLVWIHAAQRVAGIISIVAVAYVVRKSFIHWRWFVIPVTCLFAIMPPVLAAEHYAHVTAFLFWSTAWTMAGWTSWTDSLDRGHPPANYRWWAFFAAFSCLLLLKPVTRLLLPGLALGFMVSGLWRHLRRVHVVGFALLVPLLLSMGTASQVWSHLMVTAFPALQLDTQIEADLKKEAAGLVDFARKNVDRYYQVDGGEQKTLVQNPRDEDRNLRPHWRALGDDRDRMLKAYRAMVLEAFLAEPATIARIGYQRTIYLLSIWPKSGYLDPSVDDPRRLESTYEDYQKKPKRFRTLKKVFGIEPNEPDPDYSMLKDRAVGLPALSAVLNRVTAALPFTHIRAASSEEISWGLTPLGFLLAVGFVLPLLPHYRRSLGVWALAVGVYLIGAGVIVSNIPPRQAMPVAFILLMLCLIPLDLLLRFLNALRRDRLGALTP